MKVVEFVDGWTPGGVEKYIIQLIKSIDRNRFNPIILTTQKKTELFDKDISDNNIEFIVMGKVKEKNPIFRIIHSLIGFREYIAMFSTYMQVTGSY